MKKRLRIQSAVSKDSGLILIEGNRKKKNYHTAKEKISNGSASERVREIKSLINANKIKAAITLCVEVLNDDPDNADGWFLPCLSA